MVARRPDPDPGPKPTEHDGLGVVPVATLVVDPAADDVVYANPAAAALLTCTTADIEAQPLSRVLSGSGPQCLFRIGDRSVPVFVIGDADWRDAPGPTTVALLDRFQLATMALDDTDLKTHCAQTKRDLDAFREGQNRFVSVWAHELKTPLTVIQSYLEILTGDLNEGLSNEQLSFLKITQESVTRLRRLVLDVVDVVGFSSGHLSVETAAVDVDDLLTECFDALQPLAAESGIALIHERPAVRVLIRADADRVAQILRNLIDNAIKFSPPEGRITVRTRVEPDWVKVEVQDTGAGILPEDLDRIFEEFIQVQHRGFRRQPGSGLGLSISKRIAEAHGGTIEVESTVGEGSTFALKLPREYE